MIYTYSTYLKEKYSRRVFRVGLSTGLKCPHRINSGGCIFCDPETFTGEYQAKDLSVKEQLEDAVPRIFKTCGKVGLLAYFQDETSTAGEISYLDKKFRQALEYPDILGLIVSTRPEYVTAEIVDLLRSYKVPVTIEIGLQSVKENSLKFLNRGHDLASVESAIELCKGNDLDLGVHVITGIPGETIEDMKDTIKFISDRPAIKQVKFHNLVVYKNTLLEKYYEEVKFKIISLDEHIDVLCHLIPILRGDIVISRLFTSNIRRTQTAIGNYSGSKPEWLHSLKIKLIENSIIQGCKTEIPFKLEKNIKI